MMLDSPTGCLTEAQRQDLPEEELLLEGVGD